MTYADPADRGPKAAKARYLASPKGAAKTKEYKQSPAGKASNRKYKYNLTADEHAAMLVEQGGMCAICRVKPATDTDHDYGTGKVRAILCHRCNIGIGMLGDHSDGVQPAFRFLALHDGAFLGAGL